MGSRFELSDAGVFLGDGAGDVLVCFLPLVVLGFVGSAALTLAFEGFGCFLQLKAMAFKEGIALEEDLLLPVKFFFYGFKI